MTEIAAATADQEVDDSRRKFLIFATTATGVIGAAFTVTPFIKSWAPSERARALGAPVEVDVSKIDVGQQIVAMWRKQPIYIVRRSAQMVAALPKNDANLKDPKSLASDQPAYTQNESRARRADLLVVIGICTHLGCLPKQFFDAGDPVLGADWPGGWRCPCHGSKYDLAGRVFDGSPAPTNLSIPPYSFRTEAALVIGLDNTATEGAA